MSRWRRERSLTTVTEIKIAALEVPWLVNEEKVTRYALMLERLPPVVVFDIGGDPVVADGYHRINAARRLEHPTIKAQIWRGTWDDALAFAADTLAAERGLAIEVALGMIRRHMGGVAMPRTVRRRLESCPVAAFGATTRAAPNTLPDGIPPNTPNLPDLRFRLHACEHRVTASAQARIRRDTALRRGSGYEQAEAEFCLVEADEVAVALSPPA